MPPTLHDLLREAVADETMPDLSDVTWRGGLRVRRRRRTTSALAGVAAAVVAVVGVTAVLGGPGGDREPTGPGTTGPTTTRTTTTTTGPDRADAAFRGYSVWWGPTTSEERDLPPVSSPLPPSIDLAADAPGLAGHPIGRALAAYTVTGDGPDGMLVLAADGSLRRVDLARVGPIGDHDRTVSSAQEALSPTGRYLVFPQPGHVLFLTLASGRWHDWPTPGVSAAWPRWVGDDTVYLQPRYTGGEGPTVSVGHGLDGGLDVSPFADELRGGTPYGREGQIASDHSWVAPPSVPVPGGTPTPAQVLLAAGPKGGGLLVFGSDAEAARPARCCSLVFTLGDRRLVYESPDLGGVTRLVAWDIATHRFATVATVSGAGSGSVVSSYAQLGRMGG